jgi:protein-S-isoprenylcysteine O-methyltransferase Ste14
MSKYVEVIFTVDLIVLIMLLIGALWSVAVPNKRTWPPPSNKAWQYYLAWILFCLVSGLNTLLIVFDWNTWVFDNPLRFFLGVPLILIGSLLVMWGIRTLGTRNTSGLADKFVKDGPYRFTRNPQYLGDIVLYVGLCLVTNSLYLWITHILLILNFVITTISEEDWLLDQYGDPYREYLEGTSRFL